MGGTRYNFVHRGCLNISLPGLNALRCQLPGAAADCSLGNSTVNSEPSSTLLDTLTTPPCASTIALTRLNPRPSPRCDRLLSPRYKRDQIFSCSSGGIPMPVSRNLTVGLPASVRTSIAIFPP